MAKRSGLTAHGLKKSGNPFGSNSNSGRGLMTAQNRPYNGSPVLVVKGKPARSNGVKNISGRATKNWSADPNRKRKKN